MSNEVARMQSNALQKASESQNPLSGPWIRTNDMLAIAATYSGKRIRDFDHNDMRMLVELMGLWRINLGVTAESTAEELVVICQFVYDNFGQFTLDDIRAAMNLVISGKIHLEYVTQRNISSYYVSRALKAYEDYKREMVNQIAIDKENYLKRQEQRNRIELTPLERANSFKDHLSSVFEEYKRNGTVTDIGDMIYNWGRTNGFVRPSEKTVQDALVYATQKYREQKSKEFRGVIYNEPEETDSDKFLKKKFAREYVLKQFFDSYYMQDLLGLIKVEQFMAKPSS